MNYLLILAMTLVDSRQHQSKNTSSPCIVVSYGKYVEVSQNRSTPKSSISMGFSIINHPAIGVPSFMEIPHEYHEYTPFIAGDVDLVFSEQGGCAIQRLPPRSVPRA